VSWRRYAVLLAALLAGALLAGPAQARTGPVARNGVVELGPQAVGGEVYELHGDWGFAWQRFLDPEDPARPAATAPVPSKWNDVIAGGKPPGTEGYGTYTLQVNCRPGQHCR
jgi:hypothetical protein